MSERVIRPGFALPAVLGVTGVVTLVFLVAMTALASLTAEAASTRARLRFLQNALSQEATLEYLLATEPLNNSGIAVGASRSAPGFESVETVATPAPTGSDIIYLDGRQYLVGDAENTVVELRDQAGMINIAGLNDVQMGRLGPLLGLPATASRNLFAIQSDYVDADDLRQPAGAERQDYGGDLANRQFRRPSEWLSLLGIRQAVDMPRWRQLRSEVAVDHTLPSVNVNTASSSTLQVLFGVTAQQADSAIRARQVTPFYSLQEFTSAAGVPPQMEDGLYTFPSGRVVFTIRDTRSPWVYRARLTLTPTGVEKPVWIDQSELTEAPRRAAADTSNAVRFPYSAY